MTPRRRRDRPLSAQGAGALQWLASRGNMRVSCGPNRFIGDEIIYITAAGQEEADRLLGVHGDLTEDDE